MSPTYLTNAGHQKLQQEQTSLQKQKIKLTEEVNQAAAMGDLRENAEYHAARERLQHVSQRLGELFQKLGDLQIIDDLATKDGEARVGIRVTLEDQQTSERYSYLLVGPDEADPAHEKLSIASPLGKSLLGKKEGDEFILKLPKAIVPYKVLKLERPST